MNVAGSSSLSNLSSAANAPQVKVLNSQRDQLEAVVGTLLQGVQETAQAVRASGKGQRLNIVA